MKDTEHQSHLGWPAQYREEETRKTGTLKTVYGEEDTAQVNVCMCVCVCVHACDMKTTKEAPGEHTSDTHLSRYREGLLGERTFKP